MNIDEFTDLFQEIAIRFEWRASDNQRLAGKLKPEFNTNSIHWSFCPITALAFCKINPLYGSHDYKDDMELRRFEWRVVDSRREVRDSIHWSFCPLTAPAFCKINKLYGSHDYKDAGRALGLSEADIDIIMTATDYHIGYDMKLRCKLMSSAGIK